MAVRDDREDEREKEHAARDRDRLAAIGEIAAEVAHELRNVLADYLLRARCVARQDPANSGAQLERIERNARLAFSIVDDLMSLARGEPADTTPVLVVELAVAARAEIPAGAAAWDDAVSPSDLRVRAHAGLIARVLHALYDNAIQVCAPRAPTIATRGRSEGNRAILEVSDDGPGVPPGAGGANLRPPRDRTDGRVGPRTGHGEANHGRARGLDHARHGWQRRRGDVSD